MQLTMDAVNQLISAKRVELEEKFQAFRTAERELAELKQQRERLLYNGMTRNEYISYLSEHPQDKVFDGFTITIHGWMMHSTVTLDDGTKLTFSTTIYQDQQTFKVSVLTKNKRYFEYNNEYPAKYAFILDKVKEAAFGLKMIEPDI